MSANLTKTNTQRSVILRYIENPDPLTDPDLGPEGILEPKIKNVLRFTHPRAIPNLHFFNGTQQDLDRTDSLGQHFLRKK